MKKELTREELIEIIASDHGLGPDVTEIFTTEELQKAYDSQQGAFVYIRALIVVLQDRLDDQDEIQPN